MKRFLLTFCILLLIGSGHLRAHQSCTQHPASEPVTGHMLPNPLAADDEYVALQNGCPSSDHDKQVIKMAPTEVTEEEEDGHEVISFKYFAAFVLAQSVHNVRERLQFTPLFKPVSTSRRHLIFRVLRN